MTGKKVGASIGKTVQFILFLAVRPARKRDQMVPAEVHRRCSILLPGSHGRAAIYQMGILQDLLAMPQDGDIRYERDMHYDPDVPFYGSAMLSVRNPITEKDYGYAIRNYIASPINGQEYRFEIDSLRANEREWLDGMIAVRGKGMAEVSLRYRITSDWTDGSVEGRLVYGLK